MSDTPMIYQAMSAAMAEIGAVTKAKKNAQQGFMYRGIDDVMNALYPVLSKHGLFLSPEVLEHRREERQTKSGGNLIYSIMKIRYTMYAGDGSSVSATVIGEGMDSADKSSNKAMAIAMKYAMFQLFCIPTEEMAAADPDGECHDESVPRAYDPRPEIERIKQQYSVDDKGFASMRAALIAGGAVADKPGKEMTPEDWSALFRAIDANFGGAE